MTWYRLVTQDARWNTWVLKGAFMLPDGPPADPWMLRRGRLVEVTTLSFRTFSEGPRVALLPVVPLVRAELGHGLAELAGAAVQLLPAVVDGSTEPAYVALNVLTHVDAIDHAAMQRPRWPADQPGVPAEYKDGIGLSIFEDELEGHDVIRPVQFTRAVLVSERVRKVIERLGGRHRGVDFLPIPASRS